MTRSAIGGRGARLRAEIIFLSVAVIAMLLASLGTAPFASAAAPVPTITPTGSMPNPVVNGKGALYAWGAAMLPDGTMAIGDIWNASVTQFDTNGNKIATLFRLPSGENPYGLAVDPNDWTIYVGASSCCWVYRYVRDPVTGLYSQGATITNNSFKYPSRVAVRDDGYVYIADMIGGLIYVYDNAGTLKFTIGTKGSNPGQLKQPRAMAFDGTGRLYVVDAFNFRVSVFTEAGKFLFAFGSQGKNPGQFAGSDIRGLSLDRTNGWVYVVDGVSNYINKYDLNGNYLMRFGGTGGRTATVCCSTPLGTFQDGGRESALDGNGNLWVGDMPAFRAQVFSPTGTPLFQVTGVDPFPRPGGFNYPEGVAIDSNGNVVVSDSRNFRIQKFNASGVFQWQFGLRGRFSGYALNYTRGVNTDPRDGSILVADNFSSLVKKYDANGVYKWKVGGQGSGPGQLNHPSQAAVGPDGTVYVADSWNKRIVVYSETGTYLRTITSGPGFTLKDPRGIVVDTNGDLYVTDWAARAVFHLRNDGTWISTIGPGGPTLTNPNQSAVYGTYLFLADTFANNVLIYDKTTGTYLTSITGLKGPSGISISPTGRLVVAEQYTGKISTFQIS
jgi:sugar lactone lactonase YvrE